MTPETRAAIESTGDGHVTATRTPRPAPFIWRPWLAPPAPALSPRRIERMRDLAASLVRSADAAVELAAVLDPGDAEAWRAFARDQANKSLRLSLVAEEREEWSP